MEKDVIKAYRKANREIELERNGGHWTAVKRTWKNKRAYNKKDKSYRKETDNSYLCLIDYYIFSVST